MTQELRFIIRADGAAQASKDIDLVDRSALRLTKSAGGLAGIAGPAALVAAAGAAAVGFVRAADAVTTLQNSLKLATGSSTAAAAAYESLFDIAQRSRTSFTELGSTYAALARAGNEMGVSQQRLLKVTEAVGNAVAISGGSAESARAALVQLGQGLASGVLRGEELNSIMEQTPRLARAIADGLNVPIGKLRELGAAGELTAEQVLNALEASAGTLANEVQGSTVTVGQAFTQLQNATLKAVGDIDAATGASAGLASEIQALAGFITDFVAAGRELGIFATVAETVKLLWSDVRFVFKSVGAEIGGIAAQLAQLASGNVAGAAAIGREMRADAQARRAALDAYQAGVVAPRAGSRFDAADSAGDASIERRNREAVATSRARADAEGKLLAIREKLSGVSKTHAADVKALDAAEKQGLITTKQRVALEAELAAKASGKKRTDEAAKFLEAQASANRSLQEQIDLNHARVAAGGEVSRAQELEIKLTADLAERTSKLSAADRARTASAIEAAQAMIRRAVASEQALELAKAETKAAEEAARARADARRAEEAGIAQFEAAERSARQQALDSVRERTQSLRDELAAADLAKAANIDLAVAVERVAIARLEERAAQYQEGSEPYLAVRREIEARLELLALVSDRSARDAAATVAKEAADEWKRSVDQVGQSLADALMQGGRSAVEYIKGLFRTLVLRPVIEAVTTPLAESVLALLGFQGSGGAARAGANVLQLAKTGNGLYGYGAKAYNWLTGAGAGTTYGTAATIGGTVAQSSATKAALFGNAGYGEAAASGASSAGGAGGAGAGSWGAAAGYAAVIAASIIASDKAYSRGFTGSDQLSGKAWYEASPANLVRSVLGKLGVSKKWSEILSGSVALNDTFGYSATRVESSGVQGTIGAGDFTGQAYADLRSKAGWGRKLFGAKDRTSTEFAALPDEIGNFLDAAAKSVFDQATKFGEALGLPAKELAGITTDIKVKLTGDVERDKAELAKALGGYGDALVNSWADAVKPLAQYGETTADTIARVGGALLGVNHVLDTLGVAALGASTAGGQAAVALQQLFGGQQGLENAAGGYLQAFYSEAERADLAMAGISKTLAEVGIAAPTTREAFRDLVDAQNLTTDSGRAAFAALLQVSGAFAELVPATGELAQSMRTAAQVAQERAKLEDDLLQVQGNTVAIRQREREALDESNRALYDQIKALEDQAAAADAAAEAAEAAARLAADVRAGVDAIIGDFISGPELQRYKANRIAERLGTVGIEATPEGVLGATRDDIVALWRAVGDEAKLVITSLYDDWKALQVEIAQSNIDTFLAGLGASADELASALTEINPPAEGLIDAWRRSRDEVKALSDALDEIEGTRAASALDTLRATIERRDGLRNVISGNADRAFDLRVGQGGQQAVALLRQREADLWREFASTSNPAVAQAITDTTLQRVALEASLQERANAAQISALEEQITAAQRLRDVASEMGGFVQSLRAGNLSTLSFGGRLDTQRGIFEASLASGQDVQGQAQTYLQMAQQAYGGSTAQYAAVFAQVTQQLEALGLAGAGAQDTITDAQAQLDALRSIGDASGAQIAALEGLNLQFSGSLGVLDNSVQEQLAVQREQLAVQRDQLQAMEAQIEQAGLAYQRMLDALALIADGAGAALSVELAGARP